MTLSLSLSLVQASLCFSRLSATSPFPLKQDDITQFVGWVLTQMKHTVSYAVKSLVKITDSLLFIHVCP